MFLATSLPAGKHSKLVSNQSHCLSYVLDVFDCLSNCSSSGICFPGQDQSHCLKHNGMMGFILVDALGDLIACATGKRTSETVTHGLMTFAYAGTCEQLTL